MNKFRFLCLIIVCLIILPLLSKAQMKAGKYVISSGAEISENQQCVLRSSVGQNILGVSGNNNFNLNSGFWDPSDFGTYIQPVAKDGFMLYPNPVVRYLNICFEGEGTMEICSINGMVARKSRISGNQIIDVSHLTSGMYFLRISNQNRTETGRFIKH